MRKIFPPIFLLMIIFAVSSAPSPARNTGKFIDPILTGFYSGPNVCSVEGNY